jgi:hypothetical protein
MSDGPQLLVQRFTELLWSHLAARALSSGSIVSLSVQYADGATPPDSYLPEIVIRVRATDGTVSFLDLNEFGDELWGDDDQEGPLDELATAVDAEGEATGNRDAHQRAVMAQLADRIELRLRANGLVAADFRSRSYGFD